ncbi:MULTISPECIES: LacI family DNA-binding transcriptional regulator [unclassified Rhizobium]|uniref:LacI family DNA-binding transcriptional regulator n=1 Tax=unclassified Rhizobium TaxID=2613769 RepID=UPI0007EC0744|nr:MULTISPECIES: LacI family DNA-binding transcriptional regulator [unclassified Rhizobium]OWV66067.1 hypothetical protein ATY75_10690 [Rhizobium sp. N122]
MTRKVGKLSIQDIAEMAEVSTATVSRVVNGYPHITPEKRERVLKVIKQMQYEPSSIARELRMSQTRRIMVTAANLTSPVVDELFRGMERRATEGGYKVFFAPTSKTYDREVDLMDQLAKRVFDGAVLFGSTLSAKELEKAAKRYNIVQCSEFVPARVAGVSIDDEAAAKDLTAYLLSHGHKRIGLLRKSSTYSGQARERGYRAALKEAGMAADTPLIFEADYTYQGGIDATATLLSSHPDITSIFCTNDLMALGCMNALRASGRKVPNDITVVGFDGTIESTMCEPQITTISQPHFEIGYCSMDTLINTIESGRRQSMHRFLPHTLTIRGSA